MKPTKVGIKSGQKSIFKGVFDQFLQRFRRLQTTKYSQLADHAKIADPANSPTVITIRQPHRRQQDVASLSYIVIFNHCGISEKNVGIKNLK